jgi:hypothetical protein
MLFNLFYLLVVTFLALDRVNNIVITNYKFLPAPLAPISQITPTVQEVFVSLQHNQNFTSTTFVLRHVCLQPTRPKIHHSISSPPLSPTAQELFEHKHQQNEDNMSCTSGSFLRYVCPRNQPRKTSAVHASATQTRPDESSYVSSQPKSAVSMNHLVVYKHKKHQVSQSHPAQSVSQSPHQLAVYQVKSQTYKKWTNAQLKIM